MLNIEEGTALIKMARSCIYAHLNGKKCESFTDFPKFNDKSGVFVTLNSYPEKNLRGCIGFPEPVYPLVDSLLEAAVASATHDPRFHPIQLDELDSIIIEVTVLTPPELINGKKGMDILDEIEIGRDGLIIEKGFQKGLLLPQVPIEWKWDKEEFISHTCIKAGLPPDAWLDDDVKIYKFCGQIFSELKPNGKIIESCRK